VGVLAPRGTAVPRGLANLLKLYRVRSKNLREGGVQAKGYLREDMTGSWRSYVPGASPASRRPTGSESAGQPWDASGTQADSGTRPTPGQQL
jgi:hypothetical protein